MICALLRAQGLLQLACLLLPVIMLLSWSAPVNAMAEGKKCPLHQAGAALDAANGQAKDRLLQFEQDFPAQSNGRRYQIGEANANETYCDGTKEQKYCNKVCPRSTVCTQTMTGSDDLFCAFFSFSFLLLYRSTVLGVSSFRATASTARG
jgi:hypothetical protein